MGSLTIRNARAGGREIKAWALVLGLCLVLTPIYCEAAPSTRPAYLDPVAFPPAPDSTFLVQGPVLLHLPGVGGYLGCDYRMLHGLLDAKLDAHLFFYDWTEHDPGIDALHAYARNRKEAARVAQMLVDHARFDPSDPMYLTAHSGGGAIAVWALEKLPPDVCLDQVVLMAPALSPTYDLTRALRHVKGHLYVFSSIHDTLVLYTGTRMFGTMDGVQVAAAGYGGFVRPATADAKEYMKLVPCPYKPQWIQYNDWGDHIGAMSRAFAAHVIAPLLVPSKVAATEPAENPTRKLEALER